MVSRAATEVEKMGLPSAPIICSGFATQGAETSKGLGIPGGLPFVLYPTHIDTHSKKELKETGQTSIADQIVKSLTVQPKEADLPPEWDVGQTMFKGTFEEVNEFFYKNDWTDGLPIVPPTIEKVKEFLKFTDRAPGDVVGVIKPDNRKGTVWSIAVNGVMAGCRPEYMPVLIALVEAMADPKFFVENIGNTPGGETLIVINGPIIKDLEFNYEQGVTRTGFVANTSIARFWRLFNRNVGGMLLHKTDKGTFGGNFRIVLAENHDVLKKIGWPPISTDFGFKADDNAVTIALCVSCEPIPSVPASSDRLDDALAHLAKETINAVTWTTVLNYRGVSTRPILVLSPIIAQEIAKGGYSRADMKKYLYDRARRSAKETEQLIIWQNIPADKPTLCDLVKKGQLPKTYCESTDPNRMVPLTLSVDDFLIGVSGDPDRTNAMVCDQNAVHGWPVSRTIKLPPNWGEMLKKAKSDREALLKRLTVLPSK